MNRTPDEQLIYDALSRVATPPCDIERAVRRRLAAGIPRQRRALPRRTLLLAAALALFLIIGAAAAGVSGLWQRFWPGAAIPPSAVTAPGVSQTAGDYTLTLEDVMADDSGIILLLSLSRADGGAIDPDARLSTHSMDIALLADGQSFSGGGMDAPVLSEDGKTLFFCCELADHRLSGGVSLSGRQLTFTADGVAVPLYSSGAFGYQPDEAVSLAPLAGLDIPDLSGMASWNHGADISSAASAIEAQNISISLPLSESFPQYAVRGCAATENGLAVALTEGRSQNGAYVCAGILPEALVDVRTGTRYSMYEGNQLTLPGGGSVILYTFRDCPLTAADLPYLELEVSYQIDKLLSDRPFSLTFTSDQSAALAAAVQADVALDGITLSLTELRLSALDVSFTVENGIDALNLLFDQGAAPVLTLTDGSRIATVWQGASGSANGPSSAHFRPQDADGNRIFPDTADIASVSLVGQIIWTAP